MPSSDVAPPPSSTPIEQASQEAVASGSLTDRAKTIAGSIQAAATTTPGALGTTITHNAAFAGIDNLTTNEPATAALSWLVTFWYQGIKHSPHINQDRAKWFLVPLMAIFVGFFTWWAITPGHDPLMAIGKALENAGVMAANAIANYHSTRPLGWFESAADMNAVAPDVLPEGVTG